MFNISMIKSKIIKFLVVDEGFNGDCLQQHHPKFAMPFLFAYPAFFLHCLVGFLVGFCTYNKITFKVFFCFL